MTAEQGKNGSPYHPDEPAGNGFVFYGRETLFPWIQAALLQAAPENGSQHPVILIGPPHIGKTSILKQIESGRLTPPYTALYINLAELSNNSVSEILWEIAVAVEKGLNLIHVDLPPLNHTKFVSEPFRAFREQLLLPATVALNEKNPVTADGRASGKLLFLFDNLQAVNQLAGVNGEHQHPMIELQSMIYKKQLAACLFTYENQPESLPIPNFAEAQIYEVGPLSTEATLNLIREPVAYKIFKDVATYIADLSQNKPYETQLICHELYRRQQQLNLGFITVADVKAVHHLIQENGQQASQFKSEAPLFQIQQRSSSFQTIQRNGQPALWQNRRFILLAILLILIAVILTAVPAFTGKNWSEQFAGFVNYSTPQVVVIVETPTPQPTATATSTPRPTATSTDTPQPSPSPRPSATTTSQPTITPTPKPAVLPDTLIREQDQMPMRLIPGGTFMMGSEDNDFLAGLDERPLHEVSIDTFYMDQYEVSVEQYTILLNRLETYIDSCDQRDCASPRNIAGFTSFLVEEDLGDGVIQYYALTGYGDYPMNHVSWYGASVYCQFVGGRLPTEAEWEYAARGSDGRVYPWGDNPPNPERAVYQSQDFSNLKPVDALPEGVSPFGLYAMAGSVWEWTADWYDESYYEESLTDNPNGPESGIYKVIRGGGWPHNNGLDRIRSANRNSLSPDFFSSTTGFRCAYDP